MNYFKKVVTQTLIKLHFEIPYFYHLGHTYLDISKANFFLVWTIFRWCLLYYFYQLIITMKSIELTFKFHFGLGSSRAIFSILPPYASSPSFSLLRFCNLICVEVEVAMKKNFEELTGFEKLAKLTKLNSRWCHHFLLKCLVKVFLSELLPH